MSNLMLIGHVDTCECFYVKSIVTDRWYTIHGNTTDSIANAVRVPIMPLAAETIVHAYPDCCVVLATKHTIHDSIRKLVRHGRRHSVDAQSFVSLLAEGLEIEDFRVRLQELCDKGKLKGLLKI